MMSKTGKATVIALAVDCNAACRQPRTGSGVDHSPQPQRDTGQQLPIRRGLVREDAMSGQSGVTSPEERHIARAGVAELRRDGLELRTAHRLTRRRDTPAASTRSPAMKSGWSAINVPGSSAPARWSLAGTDPRGRGNRPRTATRPAPTASPASRRPAARSGRSARISTRAPHNRRALILQRTGRTWRVSAAPTVATYERLKAVDATGPADAWAVGWGTATSKRAAYRSCCAGTAPAGLRCTAGLRPSTMLPGSTREHPATLGGRVVLERRRTPAVCRPVRRDHGVVARRPSRGVVSSPTSSRCPRPPSSRSAGPMVPRW